MAKLKSAVASFLRIQPVLSLSIMALQHSSVWGSVSASAVNLGCSETSCQSPLQATKTVYLIRHAESEENRRFGSLKAAVKAVTRFSWPSSKDLVAAMELVRVDQQIDSAVSDFGQRQIAHMAKVLDDSKFITANKIQLVAHSPLLRARETCRGMLGCMAPDIFATESSLSTVQTVCELDLLTEKTPAEWIPGNAASFRRRLVALEDWIAERPETVMALVGHSQFFKAMLSLDYKFGNCDVMKVQFHPPATGAVEDTICTKSSHVEATRWSNLKEVHICRLQPLAFEPSEPTSPS